MSDQSLSWSDIGQVTFEKLFSSLIVGRKVLKQAGVVHNTKSIKIAVHAIPKREMHSKDTTVLL